MSRVFQRYSMGHSDLRRRCITDYNRDHDVAGVNVIACKRARGHPGDKTSEAGLEIDQRGIKLFNARA